jgi:hypothetical protein
MNLSDAGIEAFKLTMNCAIGTSLQKKSDKPVDHVELQRDDNRNKMVVPFGIYELTRR